MSSKGAEQTAPPQRSGRWVTTAPTERPPFDRPVTASLSAFVYPAEQRYSPAATKSSKVCCLFVPVAASCHSSPSSGAPRAQTCAYTPPSARRPDRNRSNLGGLLDRKPP